MAKKQNPLCLANTEQLNETVDEIARLEVKKRGLEAARDKAIQAVRENHDAKIEETSTQIKALAKLAGIFCKAKRETLFGKLKSAASALARYGFRDGTPALCLLNTKTTWAQVLAKIKEQGRQHFIRTVEEVDKEAIKSAKLSDGILADLGLRMDNKETFFVESKSDDAGRIKTDAEEIAAV